MENLSLDGQPPGLEGQPLGPGLSPGPSQQLPPQMFTTAAQLLDMTDSTLYDLERTMAAGR
jgi:U6 snRNA-associated Sm-like protein LSm1